MIDTLEFLDELKEDFEPSQAEKLARLMARIYKELANTVTKEDFRQLTDTVNKLTESVKELAEAQRQTEQRLNELAEAKKRTEERLTRLEGIVEELAEAQKRSEERLTRLEGIVEELAEAQRRTEERVNELAEAQRETQKEVSRLDRALNELAEAQKRTEKGLQKLARGLDETREQLGGLSDTVGYTLENEAFKALPLLLKRDYGLTVKGRLKRGYLRDAHGRQIEVNIIGEGTKNGKKVFIIGEGKARLSKKAVKEFIEKRLNRLEPVLKQVFPVLVTHMISEPDVEEYAREKGIALYYSYDF